MDNNDLIKDKFFKAIDSLDRTDVYNSCPPFGWFTFTLKDKSVWKIDSTGGGNFFTNAICHARIDKFMVEINETTYNEIRDYFTKKVFSLH